MIQIKIDYLWNSLKSVLLHNRKYLNSISNVHSVHLKETYGIFKALLKYLNYGKYFWTIFEDLLGDVVNYFLTKMQCFFNDTAESKTRVGR